MEKGFTIFKTQKPESNMILPPNLMDSLRLKVNQTINIKCGSTTTKTTLSTGRPDKSTSQLIGISDRLLKKLGLPPYVSLRIRADKSNELQLGPVIGLLAFSSHIPDRLYYYKAYANAAKNNKFLFYVFQKSEINYRKKTVTGYYFDYLENCWKNNEFPMPDVVLDRRYPNSDKSHHSLAKAIGSNRIFNNRTMITKSQFYRTLIKDLYLKNFLPETRPLRNARDLTHLLGKYETVILKPENSMKGSGIVAVTKNSDNELECKFKIDKSDTLQCIKSADQIFNVLKMAAGRERKYLAQQAITCLEYCGGPFSLRTCPTKNGNGQWVIPGMLALASMGKSFITNYSSGAERVPLKNLFEEILPKLSQSQEQFLDKINELTIKAAECLDNAYGPLGELGLDIIIDHDGKPWLLEANGNPGRIPIFYQTEYPLWPSELYQLPLNYASYLAGFNPS